VEFVGEALMLPARLAPIDRAFESHGLETGGDGPAAAPREFGVVG